MTRIKARNIILCCLILLLSPLFFLRCAKEVEEVKEAKVELPARPTQETINMGPGYPQVNLAVYPFNIELKVPVTLNPTSRISFIPLLLQSEGNNSQIVVFFSTQAGDSGKELGSFSPVALADFSGKDFSHQIDILAQRVELDPGISSETSGVLRFVLRDEDVKASAGVGYLKIIQKEAPKPDRPPILLICSDAHRYDCSVADKGKKLMPRLQQLMQHSVVYSRAFSNASWTLPSITSTMTGEFPRYHRTGKRIKRGSFEELRSLQLDLGQFLLNWGGNSFILTAYPNQLRTITEVLGERSEYQTGMVFANPLYSLSGLSLDGPDVSVDTSVLPGDQVNAAAFQVMDNYVEGSPAFLLVHYMDVHHYVQFYYNLRFPGAKPADHPKELVQCYLDAVRDCDRFLNELLDKWDQKYGLEKSLIVFYADHGEHLFDPGRNLTGHGVSMEEPLMHVPMVVHYPVSMKVTPGEITVPVSLTDLKATLLDLLGIEGEEMHSGFYPFPQKNVAAEAGSVRSIFADYQLYSDEMSSVREDYFKLVFNFDRDTREFVDTSLPLGDQGELGQVVKNHPDQPRLKKHFQQYENQAEEVAGNLVSDHNVDVEEAMKALRNLGYAR